MFTRTCSLRKAAENGVVPVAFTPSAAVAIGSVVSLKISPVPISTHSVPIRSVVWCTAPPSPSITDFEVYLLMLIRVMMLKS